MGWGHEYRCQKCGKNGEIYCDSGMEYEQECKETYQAAQCGRMGSDWEICVKQNPLGAFDCKREVYKCACCGFWKNDSRKNYYISGQREAWYCVNGCKTNRYLDDKVFFADLFTIINRVICRPEFLIRTEGECSVYSPSIKVQRDERTLSDLLQKDKVSFQSAKKALFNILSEKFDCCTLDRTADVTDALIAYMGGIEQINSVDVDLFKVIIEEILVDKDGEITVRFVNDAVIGKDKEVMTNE